MYQYKLLKFNGKKTSRFSSCKVVKLLAFWWTQNKNYSFSTIFTDLYPPYFSFAEILYFKIKLLQSSLKPVKMVDLHCFQKRLVSMTEWRWPKPEIEYDRKRGTLHVWTWPNMTTTNVHLLNMTENDWIWPNIKKKFKIPQRQTCMVEYDRNYLVIFIRSC